MTTKLKSVKETLQAKFTDKVTIGEYRFAEENMNEDRHTIYTALKEGIEAMRETNSPLESSVTVNYTVDKMLTLLDELFGVSK